MEDTDTDTYALLSTDKGMVSTDADVVELEPTLDVRPWDEPLERSDFAEAVCVYVACNDWVTFPALQRLLEGRMDVRGTRSIRFGGDTNVVLWGGMNEQFADLIVGLWNERRIHPWPVSGWAYHQAGATLSLPPAKRRPAEGYTTPHWLPVAFRRRAF